MAGTDRPGDDCLPCRIADVGARSARGSTGLALGVLGFEFGAKTPSNRDILAKFRERMRDVHPDHGGDSLDAAKAMSDLAEARRVLSTTPE